MKVVLEKEKENVVKLDITIPAKDAVDAYNNAVRKISQYVNIDGFRRGKAPRAVVERHVGTERIKQEAIESLMPRAINQAVADNKLDLIAQPYVTNYNFNIGEDLTVTAKAELRPEVTLGQYKDLTVEVKDTPVEEDALQKQLDRLLEQHSVQETVIDRPTKDTDIAVIDFDGYVNGEKIQGGEAKNYPLDLGHSNFIPGFADQLVGKNLNDEFDIKVTFPEEYHAEELKGKPAMFKVKVKEIKEKVLPELDDDFAQDVSDFDTLAEYKEDLKKNITVRKENEAKAKKEDEAIAKIIETSKMDIPEAMINTQVNRMLEDFAQRLQSQGLSVEQYFQYTGVTAEKIIEDMKPQAVKNIQSRLVLEAIVKAENIEVSDEEFEAELNKMAEQYKMEIEKIKEFMGEYESKQIREDIAIQKAVDVIVNSVVEK